MEPELPQSQPPLVDALASAAPAAARRLWTPLAVALYGLLLGYPFAVPLAFKNWKALGMRREGTMHLIGAIILSIPFSGILLFTSDRTGRLFGLVLNVMAFSYLKAKLRSDEAAFKAANQSAVEYRTWYSGCGWALLGLLLFCVIFFIVLFVLVAADAPLPE
jgi:hypothetical protein